MKGGWLDGWMVGWLDGWMDGWQMGRWHGKVGGVRTKDKPSQEKQCSRKCLSDELLVPRIGVEGFIYCCQLAIYSLRQWMWYWQWQRKP